MSETEIPLRQRCDTETVVAVISIQEDGRVNTWGGIHTADRVEWLDCRLADARELLTVCMPAPILQEPIDHD